MHRGTSSGLSLWKPI